MKYSIQLIFVLLLLPCKLDAQRFLDSQDKAWFGVNYCAPFAHGYRVHKRLGKDAKQAIDRDVYHMSRLGLNAYRLHVWDVEISDAKGNLLDNEHLDLLDYTISRMQYYGIDVTVTPIAFWGNGWPEPDDRSQPGFSNLKSKAELLLDEPSIKAMENYLRQFMKHENHYTGNTYAAEPNIVAVEVNNEPREAGTDKQVTSYINRMVKAIRSSGCKKPVLYNISENSSKFQATLNANIDGFTMQWYPLGLCSGAARQENCLPLVSHYNIPFSKMKGYANKLRWIYEFDSADMLGNYMYPAMARSFREAGFQWATQFAYDPFWEAPVNTDYNTHYMNLCYTPNKAIGLMIAGNVFRGTKALQKQKDFPESNSFDDCTIDYSKDLVVLNSDSVIAYTNTVSDEAIKPVNTDNLRTIAGVGSSSLVKYGGTGAYFLDKIQDGLWILEVYPDALVCGNPFTNHNSAEQTVSVIQNHWLPMTINLDDLGDGFVYHSVTLNKDGAKNVRGNAEGRTFDVYPGMWFIGKKDFKMEESDSLVTAIGSGTPGALRGSDDLGDAGLYSNDDAVSIGVSTIEVGLPKGDYPVCPSNLVENRVVLHAPSSTVAGTAIDIEADVALANDGSSDIIPTVVDSAAVKVWLVGSVRGGRYFRLPMYKKTGTPYKYTAVLGTDILSEPGIVDFSVMVEDAQGNKISYPSGLNKDPHQWDFSTTAVTYHINIVEASSPIVLFDAAETESSSSAVASPVSAVNEPQQKWQKGQFFRYIPGALEMGIENASDYKDAAGMLVQVGNKIAERESNGLEAIKLSCNALKQPITLQWQAYTTDGCFYTAETSLGAGAEQVTVPFELFKEEPLKPMRDGYPTFAYTMPQRYGKSFDAGKITSLVLLVKPQQDNARIGINRIVLTK